jgi:hypothetical protein
MIVALGVQFALEVSGALDNVERVKGTRQIDRPTTIVATSHSYTGARSRPGSRYGLVAVA